MLAFPPNNHVVILKPGDYTIDRWFQGPKVPPGTMLVTGADLLGWWISPESGNPGNAENRKYPLIAGASYQSVWCFNEIRDEMQANAWYFKRDAQSQGTPQLTVFPDSMPEEIVQTYVSTIAIASQTAALLKALKTTHGQSAADTLQTLSIASPGSGFRHVLKYASVSTSGAAAGNDIIVEAENSGGASVWEDVIGQGAPRGSTVVFSDGDVGFPIDEDTALDLTVPAGGAGVVTHAQIISEVLAV